MKKIVSIFLVVVMLFGLSSVCFAYDSTQLSDYPIVRINGNGNRIFDENGNRAYPKEYDTSRLEGDIKSVLPDLIKGLTTGKFDDYYDSLYGILINHFENARLDGDGNPMGGTDIIKSDRENMVARQNRDASASRGGKFSLGDYTFWYDWRLDPLQIADELDAYIDAILKTTGKDKVQVYVRCLGSVPIVAYLAKYGNEKIDRICLNGAVANGAEYFGEAVTGNMKIDLDAIMRSTRGGVISNNLLSGMDPALMDLLITTVRLLNSTPSGDVLVASLKRLLNGKFGRGVIATFERACYATWPGYWSMVRADEYDKAVNLIFGKEGSKLRREYAGLIEKLDNYHNLVASNIPEILKTTDANGTKFMIIAKYGYQQMPFVGSSNELSDETVSLRYSSFGATTVKIGETFSDEYIGQQIEKGLERYISVDNQVDTSTCYLPDSTWITKGVIHEDWPGADQKLAMAFFSKRINDIYSEEAYPQYLYWDKANDAFEPLTEENMNCESYYDFDTGSTANLNFFEKIKARIRNFIDFIKKVFAVLKNLVVKDKA